MCDYCDCRSHPEIAELSIEHDRLSSLLGELRTAVVATDRHAAAQATAMLHDLLHHHAAREERGVFAQLRTEVGAGYVAMFETDHARIHGLLDEADGSDWAANATELIAELGAHIAREESDLFPAAHQLLSPGQWDRITHVAHFTET